MIKLALVGSKIQHSQSPDLYRNLLKLEVQYDLLDFESSLEIPPAKELLLKYNGISITSPYKKHFISQVHLTKELQTIGAINCLYLKNGIVWAENTDYLAILDILSDYLVEFKKLNVIILGDGAMSNVTQYALSKLRIPTFKVFSRKNTKHFDQLNINEIFKNQFPESGKKLVINTCSRDFVFNGYLDNQTTFWDYNYNFLPHSETIGDQAEQYIDGLKMLELQAQHALAFWSIKT